MRALNATSTPDPTWIIHNYLCPLYYFITNPSIQWTRISPPCSVITLWYTCLTNHARVIMTPRCMVMSCYQSCCDKMSHVVSAIIVSNFKEKPQARSHDVYDAECFMTLKMHKLAVVSFHGKLFMQGILKHHLRLLKFWQVSLSW